MSVSDQKKKVRSSHPKITEFLRKEIVAGRLAPGSLLPPRLQLLKQFEAAPATIQEAIHQLRAEGFVETSSPRRGTRVVEMPPHLYHYKLIFPPTIPAKSAYYDAIVEAAQRLQTEGKCYFSIFHGVNSPKDLEGYGEILKEIEKNQIAGLFFATSGAEFWETPLFDKPGIPRFAVADAWQLGDKVSKAIFDLQSFFTLAAKMIAQQNRKKVFVLNRSSYMGYSLDKILETEMRAKGLHIPEYWAQFVASQEYAIERCLQMIFSGGKEVPDTILITDDHLVEVTTRLLQKMGSAIPENLLVVAHANFPKPTISHLPALRIGYDISELLHIGMDNLFMEQQGKKPPNFQLIKAVPAPE